MRFVPLGDGCWERNAITQLERGTMTLGVSLVDRQSRREGLAASVERRRIRSRARVIPVRFSSSVARAAVRGGAMV
jgi:hypothetical protein